MPCLRTHDALARTRDAVPLASSALTSDALCRSQDTHDLLAEQESRLSQQLTTHESSIQELVDDVHGLHDKLEAWPSTS